MILFYNSLKSFRRMSFNRTGINTVNYLLLNNKVRMFATETALQKITIRSMKKSPKYKEVLYWVLLMIPASTFALGTWQVFRKFEKDNLNEEFLKLVDQPAVDLPENLDELQSMEFRKIKVRGKFDHSKELYFGPRPKIDDYTLKDTTSLLSKRTAGYLIITPFKLSDRDLTILVNRGWVPSAEKLSSARPQGQITEEVELVGLVRHHENREPLGVRNNPARNIWVHRDLNQMAKVTGAAPVFLDADKSSSVPGGPVGGQTFVGLRNHHLSYIYTWYGLSIASGYMWYNKFLKIPIIV